MFERYTEKARRVIFFARYEASQFGSPYIETEHLLLGLLREDLRAGRPSEPEFPFHQGELLLLRRRKTYETQREQLSAQAFNLDQASFATSTLTDTASTVAAMRAQGVLVRDVDPRHEHLGPGKPLRLHRPEQGSELRDSLRAAHALPRGSGSCCVMQWNAPSPQTNSTARWPTTRRSASSSALSHSRTGSLPDAVQ